MQTKEAMLFDGYQIDTEGYISFPSIGKIFLKGLTIREAKTLLTQRIINEKILIDPIIDIKLMNSYFTILGEVNIPGRYDFLENNLNIFEAIGYAGDLTINGKRNDIKIIRQNNIKNQIINLDLTKSDFMINNYQIFSGDIIIVNPNNSRVKNAGIIGNSGTLLSLLSFILSSIIVISNN